MTDDEATAVDRRQYLQLTGVAALGTVGFAGCVGRATGTLATQVTDQPADIADFESLIVTIEGFWLGPEGADPEADGEESDDETADDDQADMNETDGNETDDGDAPAGREYFEFDESQEADLVKLQNGETQLIDERELEIGDYPYLQLDVSSADGTLNDGSDATVDLPGNAPLMFNEPFEIRENTQTTFTADFAPVLRGNGDYLLRPVPSGIEVEYSDDDEEESSDGNSSDDA